MGKPPSKWTHDDVAMILSTEGYISLTDKYLTLKDDIPMLCPDGHSIKINWFNFLRGSRCKHPSHPNLVNRVDKWCNLTASMIKLLCNKKGYSLISEVYEKPDIPIKILCKKGHPVTILLFDLLLNGATCGSCPGKLKWTIELISKKFREENYTLLSTVYKGYESKLDFICPKGHESSITLDGFVQGSRCKGCQQDRCEQTVMMRYGVDNTLKLPGVRDKRNQALIEKYGTTNLFTVPAILRKKREACIKKYGVDWPTKSRMVMNKIASTNISRYGASCVLSSRIIMEKAIKTCLDRYGADNLLSPGIKVPDDIKVLMDVYGIDHISKIPSVRDKVLQSAFSHKDYSFPSGRTVKIQGYESAAIDILLENGFKEEYIIVGSTEVPAIQYINEKGNHAIYYPDIFIPRRHSLIEVKSIYTYNMERNRNLLKIQACMDRGYHLYLYVFNVKKKLVFSQYYPRFGRIEDIENYDGEEVNEIDDHDETDDLTMDNYVELIESN